MKKYLALILLPLMFLGGCAAGGHIDVGQNTTTAVSDYA